MLQNVKNHYNVESLIIGQTLHNIATFYHVEKHPASVDTPEPVQIPPPHSDNPYPLFRHILHVHITLLYSYKPLLVQNSNNTITVQTPLHV